MLVVLMVASLVIGVGEAKPVVVNIRTRNASGQCPLKSTMAGSLLPFCPNAAIVFLPLLRLPAPVTPCVAYFLSQPAYQCSKFLKNIFYSMISNG
jgi:hypothetical protein